MKKEEKEKSEKKEKFVVTPKMFFIFYFFFFIFAILFIRYYPRSVMDGSLYERGTPYSIDTGIDNNYSYYSTISIDDNEYIYSGKRNGDYELITYDNKKYFRNDDNYFVYDSVWVKSNNPNKFSYFVDGDNFYGIIENATYESKTEYESGKVVYNFLITTDTLNKIINDTDTDYDDVTNRIQISVDENDVLNKVIYYLDSYCINNKLCNKGLKIEVSYDDINEVDKIDNPIVD